MKKPAINDYLSKAAMEKIDKADITAQWVIKNLKKTIERCMEVQPVIDQKGNHVIEVDRNGNQCLAYTFDADGALRGLELLGKYFQLFSDKHESSTMDMQVISADLDCVAAAKKYQEMMVR